MKKVHLNVESEAFAKKAYIESENCEVISVGKDFALSVMTCEENGFLSL